MRQIIAFLLFIVTLSQKAATPYYCVFPNYPDENAYCLFSENGIHYTIMEDDSTHLAVCHNVTDPNKVWSFYRNSDPLTTYTGDVVVPEFVERDGVRYTVTAVGHYAFANNTQLRSVTLPPSVTTFGKGAFRNCTALESVNISDLVNVVDEYAFSNTPSLHNLPLPSGLLNLEREAFGDNFYGEYHVPNSVFSVDCFPNCSKIVFGEYEVIDEKKCPIDFNCGGISYAAHPIKDNGGTQLKEIVLPTPYFRMFEYAVSNSSLERIILPEIEKIMIWKPAFAECPNLKEFVSMSTTPPNCAVLYGTAIDNPEGIDDKIGWLDDYSEVTLVVTEGSEEAYAADQVWGRFQTIKGDPEIGRYLLSANERISADRTEHAFAVRVENGAITVSAPEPTEIEIFIPTGVCVKRLSVCDETRIPLHGGIYLITDHRTTRKARVK